MTPVRRSMRNLPGTPKESSNICMIFPATSKSAVKELPVQKEPSNLLQDELATPLEEEPVVQSLATSDVPAPENQCSQITESNLLPQESSDSSNDVFLPLRRSTRKTPSIYKNTNDVENDNVRIWSIQY